MTLRKTVKESRAIMIGLLLPLVTLLNMLPTARAASPTSFTFTAAGDYGGITAGSNGQKVANRIAAKNPNFHIALGDLGYGAQNPANRCSSFNAIYPGGGSGSLVLVTGNHDTINPPDALTSEDGAGFLDTSTGYVSQCGAPAGISWVGSNVSYAGGRCNVSPMPISPSCYAREYYFDYPSSNPIMRFIFISAGIQGSWVDYSNNTSGGTAHYRWLKARIDEAKNAGLWVAVALHKNCISDGTDFSTCVSGFDPFNLAMTEMRGVDLWLNGHDHTYQRSYQLKAPCSNSTNVVSCGIANGASTGYVRGVGTVVNIIGTGGAGNDPICTGSCPSQSLFARLCGSNGNVSSPKTTGCNNDYGFSYFNVTTNQISATYVSVTGTFNDSYTISVRNPPGDFSVYSGAVSLSRGVIGGAGQYTSLGTININSFGGFNRTLTLTASVSVRNGICAGSDCPSAVISQPNLTPSSGGTISSSIKISTTVNTLCNNPTITSTRFYNVTVIANSTQPLLSHRFTFPVYVYGQADVTKDGAVNISDLSLVAGRFGSTNSSRNWNPNMDLNNDNRTDISDLVIVSSNFGRTSNTSGSFC